MAVSANRLELLQIADAVAREKVIDREIVITAMEDAIQKAAKSRYGAETNINAEIDPKSGEIRLQRLLEVVDISKTPPFKSTSQQRSNKIQQRPLVTLLANLCHHLILAASPHNQQSK